MQYLARLLFCYPIIPVPRNTGTNVYTLNTFLLHRQNCPQLKSEFGFMIYCFYKVVQSHLVKDYFRDCIIVTNHGVIRLVLDRRSREIKQKSRNSFPGSIQAGYMSPRAVLLLFESSSWQNCIANTRHYMRCRSRGEKKNF